MPLGAVVAGTFASFVAVAARPSSAVGSFAFLVLLLFFFGGLVESLVSLLLSFEPLPPVCLWDMVASTSLTFAQCSEAMVMQFIMVNDSFFASAASQAA